MIDPNLFAEKSSPNHLLQSLDVSCLPLDQLLDFLYTRPLTLHGTASGEGVQLVAPICRKDHLLRDLCLLALQDRFVQLKIGHVTEKPS